jgi:streptogrisin C
MFVRGTTPALKPILAALAGLALMIGTITAAQAQPTEETRQSSPQIEALARALGLSTADAEQLLTVQVKLSGLAVDLEAKLGDDTTGGSWIDAKSGTLVVAVTDAKSAEQVRAAGAEPRTVKHSRAELAEQRKELDEFARSNGAGKAQSWGTDVKSNSLLIRTVEGAEDKATKAFLAKARKLGVEVQIEQVDGTVEPAADLYGGQQVEMTGGYLCSAGFNATTSSGDPIMLTAGHCAADEPTFSKDGVEIGATRAFSFPDNDYAAVDVSSAWTQPGAVDKYDGSYVELTGAGLGAVGSAVCKSGRTTQWTCGEISSHDESVNYGNGDIVSGLTQHTACLEQGDSGGSNVAGTVAQGLTSGGMLYDQGGQLVCGEKVGQPNVGYFQPIEEALEANDATLVTG